MVEPASHWDVGLHPGGVSRACRVRCHSSCGAAEPPRQREAVASVVRAVGTLWRLQPPRLPVGAPQMATPVG